MFRSDIIFVTILVALVVLPFGSVAPGFQQFPYQLFFSALAAASIVILAWERVADRRSQRLQNQMRHLCLNGQGLELLDALNTIVNSVERHVSIPENSERLVNKAAEFLRRYGRYHRIDILYPKGAIENVDHLHKAMRQYNEVWKPMQRQIEGLLHNRPDLETLTWDLLDAIPTKRRPDARVPSAKDLSSIAEAYEFQTLGLGREANEKLSKLLIKTEEKSGVWFPALRKDVIDAAGELRELFLAFLARNGITVSPNLHAAP